MQGVRQFEIAAVLAGYLLVGVPAARGQAMLTADMVKISLEKGTITQHEPAIADITVNNRSSLGVGFDPGFDMQRLAISVTAPDGQHLEKKQATPQEGMKFSNAVRIESGMIYVMPVLLSTWFAVDRPGDYSIDVAVRLGKGSRDGTEEAKANLTLTVLPRDEDKLKSACASLLARIKDGRSAYAAIVAANALSIVDDPVAVPFLAEAMKRREFTGMMIGALSRLKTDEAVSALISASQSRDHETSALAHSALVALGKAEGP